MSIHLHRVWNTKRECYLNGRDTAITNKGELFECKHGLTPMATDIHIVERCIGSVDLYGQTIFAGDILSSMQMVGGLRYKDQQPYLDLDPDLQDRLDFNRVHSDGIDDDTYYFYESRAAVVWEGGQVSVREFDVSWMDMMGDRYSWRNCEIIGNIRENPELTGAK